MNAPMLDQTPVKPAVTEKSLEKNGVRMNGSGLPIAHTLNSAILELLIGK
jgi:hypothetical protein